MTPAILSPMSSLIFLSYYTALEVERVNVKGDRDEFVFPTTRIVAELDVANGSEANVNMPQDLMLAVANINGCYCTRGNITSCADVY